MLVPIFVFFLLLILIDALLLITLNQFCFVEVKPPVFVCFLAFEYRHNLVVFVCVKGSGFVYSVAQKNNKCIA